MPRKPENVITLCVSTVNGKWLYNTVADAIKEKKSNLSEFCLMAGISRSLIYDCKKGVKPGIEGMIKVALGLKAWGYQIEVTL